MKIIIRWNDLTADYYLLKGVKIMTQLDVVCQIFKIEDSPSRYVLYVKDKNLFISDEVLNESELQFTENSRVDLMLAPIYQVDMVMEYLNNDSSIKKGLIDLKNHLQHTTFVGEFLRKGGLNILQSIIMDQSGNTLSYSLGVFELVLNSPEFDWSQLSIKIVEKIVTLFDHNSINISNPALKIAINLANNSHGYNYLIDSIKIKNESDIYTKIINNLKHNDINTQTYTLSLINSIISSSSNPPALIDYLEDFNLSSTLKSRLGATDSQFKKQIFKFQNLKLQEIIKDSTTMYSKEDPSHQKLLKRLWELMFPCEAFKPVDEKWKLIGFQGKDPSTDFRGMGIAGLKHLLYFAENHTVSFQQLAYQQSSLQNSANDRYYPLAVCGIHITSMLLELIKPPNSNINESTNDQCIIYPMLFEHKHSLEEIYCVVIEVFAMVWDEGNAKYMDFKKVIVFLKNQITESLTKSSTVQEFKTNSFVLKKLVDLKKVFMEQPIQTGKKTQGRQSKSYNEDRKSFDYINRSVDSQHDLLAKCSISNLDQEDNVMTNSSGSGSSFSFTTNSTSSLANTTANHNNNHNHNSNDHSSIYSLSPASSSSSSQTTHENGVTIAGNTALHVAICSLQYDIVQQYLSNTNMINMTNSVGMTPINTACAQSSIMIIELILSTPGVSILIPSKNGMLPIHNLCNRKWPVHEEFHKIIKMFVEKGIEIDAKNIDTLESSLHIACSKHYEDNVRTLLYFGSNPNLFNKKGETSLHIAIGKKSRELIQLLIQNGADPNVNNCLTNESCEMMTNGDLELINFIRFCKERSSKVDRPDDQLSSSIISSINHSNINNNNSNNNNNNNLKKPIPLPKRPSISRESTQSTNLSNLTLNNNTTSGSPASSNRSLSPTPPTSPGVSSPSIRSSTTPIRHTSSMIGLSSYITDSPTSPTSFSASSPSNHVYNSNNYNHISHSYSHSHSLQQYGSPTNLSSSNNKTSIQIGRDRLNFTNSSGMDGYTNNPASSPPDLSIASNHTSSAGSSLMSLVGRGRLTSSFSSTQSRYTTQQKLDIIKRCLNEATTIIEQTIPTDPKFRENVKRATENVKNCKSLLNTLK